MEKLLLVTQLLGTLASTMQAAQASGVPVSLDAQVKTLREGVTALTEYAQATEADQEAMKKIYAEAIAGQDRRIDALVDRLDALRLEVAELKGAKVAKPPAKPRKAPAKKTATPAA